MTTTDEPFLRLAAGVMFGEDCAALRENRVGIFPFTISLLLIPLDRSLLYKRFQEQARITSAHFY
jgi:hypothetical protein